MRENQCILTSFFSSSSSIMTSLFQNATNQIKSLLTTENPKSNSCSISAKPSTMDDTNDCLMTTNTTKMNNLFRTEPDLAEDDRFRACFIDCSCDCSVRIKQKEQTIETKKLFFLSSG